MTPSDSPKPEAQPAVPAQEGVAQEPPRVPVAQLRLSPSQLFTLFLRITLSGFGGTMFWARLTLVEKRKLLTEKEFVEMLSVGQILPGANMVNLTAMFSYRTGGLRGLVAAMTGFLAPPFIIVVTLGFLYQHFGELPIVQRALAGMSAVAAGLIFANAIKLSSALPRRALPWLFSLLAFGSMGVLRMPLVVVLGVLGPVAVLIAWKKKP